jgi:hypothetical protein
LYSTRGDEYRYIFRLDPGLKSPAKEVPRKFYSQLTSKKIFCKMDSTSGMGEKMATKSRLLR